MKILRVEMLVDVIWMAFCLAYVILSLDYPPAGRLVPLTIGLAGVAIGLLHFSGNFIPLLRRYTHGDDVEEKPTAQARSIAEEAETRTGKESGEKTVPEPAESGKNYAKAVAWSIFLVVGIVLFGAIWIMPIFFIIYFGVRGGRWGLGVVSGIIMAVVTWGLFGKMMNLQLPPGIITNHIVHLLF